MEEKKTRPDTLANRINGKVLADETKNAKDYLINDVLKPNLQDVASDTIISILDSVVETVKTISDIAIYGEPQKRRRGRKSRGRGIPSYREYYSSPSETKRNKRRNNREFESEDCTVSSRADCERISNIILDILDEYEELSLAQYKETVSQNNPIYKLDIEFTDENWGWKSLKNIRPRKGYDGWYLEMPRIIEL